MKSAPLLEWAGLGLAAYLRLAHLSANPGWYTDEATHLNIAEHFLRGQIQYLAVTQSVLLFGRMPLFDWLLAGALRLGGEPMTTLRLLTGLLGVLSVAVLYAVTRALTHRRGAAGLAALALAVYPPAVLYSRLGFSYNALAPLVLLVLWGLARYWQTARGRPLNLAALAVGLGLLSDLWMGVLIAPVLGVALLKQRRAVLRAALWLSLPIALWAGGQWLTAPEAFVFDVRFTLARLSAIPLAQQGPVLIDNVAVLAREGWMLGVLGLAFLRPAPLGRLALMLAVWPMLALGRTVALYSLSAYYVIPLWPLAALGAASSIEWLARRRELWWRGAALVLLGAGGLSLVKTLPQVTHGFVSSIDDFLISPAEAQAVAGYINHHAQPDDVIIASPAVGWLLEAHTADFQMAVAATGTATPHLPANLPPERWAFDPRLERARFVVVDNLWRNWAVVDVPGVTAIMQTVQSWPVVFVAGTVNVYQNPTHE